MKITFYIFFSLLIFSLNTQAQSDVIIDSTDNKQLRKENKTERKTQRKDERKQFTQHFRISVVAAYADLNSTFRFEGPKGLFSTQVDFERHLGLEDRKTIFAGTVIYRITPRSGLIASYYRLYRSNGVNLENDIVFKRDTLKKGLLVEGYFNTDVFSFGYLLSILKDERSFLGAYFNLYVINIQAGIRSEVFEFDKSTGLLAPLPNFGITAAFQLEKWLSISGGVGLFFLNSQGLNGAFLDVHALVGFNPTKWLGITVGYYNFHVAVGWPVDDFRAYINYNYSGPSLGLAFRF